MATGAPTQRGGKRRRARPRTRRRRRAPRPCRRHRRRSARRHRGRTAPRPRRRSAADGRGGTRLHGLCGAPRTWSTRGSGRRAAQQAPPVAPQTPRARPGRRSPWPAEPVAGGGASAPGRASSPAPPSTRARDGNDARAAPSPERRRGRRRRQGPRRRGPRLRTRQSPPRPRRRRTRRRKTAGARTSSWASLCLARTTWRWETAPTSIRTAATPEEAPHSISASVAATWAHPRVPIATPADASQCTFATSSHES
ncbi:hypothetical protein M885DRAFT_192507 [Pelagophyceae sp. CCMP2097]|nr:hypothetical protein M885DRAFT_192507 [Pelagophyceae sp. CCMP2097]